MAAAWHSIYIAKNTEVLYDTRMGEHNYRDFWNEAIKQIQHELAENGQENEFKLWYTEEKIEYIEDTIDTITVAVPNEFMWNFINAKGNILKIEGKLQELGLNVKLLHIVKDLGQKPARAEPSLYTANSGAKEITNTSPKKHPNLREDYTFETFVPGDNSALAYNAALAAAKNPGKAYNPILIYGGVGLGKTHLMESIGNYIHQHGGEKKKICCIPAETFANEFIFSTRDKTTAKFKEKYRKLDVLLLDDIHFLEGKTGTNEELFYTFNDLWDRHCQMVFTCDRPVADLKDIEERLKTRFSRGLTVDLQMPNYETRKAILLKKMESKGTPIPDEVIDFIAQNIQTNVRDLEACLNKMVALADLMNQPLTLELARQQLKDLISERVPVTVTIAMIQQIVAKEYNISMEDLKGKKRNKAIMIPRHIAVYLSRIMTECSYPEIAREFNKNDHTTVMNSYTYITEHRNLDSALNARIESLKKIILEAKK